MIRRIARETANLTFWRTDAIRCLQMVHCVVQDCQVPHLVREVVEAMPASQRQGQTADMRIQQDFEAVALDWVRGMSVDACEVLIDSSDHVKLVKAASSQLRESIRKLRTEATQASRQLCEQNTDLKEASRQLYKLKEVSRQLDEYFDGAFT